MEKKQSPKEIKVADLPSGKHKAHWVGKGPSPGDLAKSLGVRQKKPRFSKKLIFCIGIIGVLLVIAWVYFIFLPNQYPFSFNVGGLDYVSNVYTPSEFFKLAKDSNSFIVSVDLLDGNTDPWAVNSMNLWIVALNADKKKVVSIVKSVDDFGNVKNCMTNDGNILHSRELTSEECSAMLGNNSFMRINLHTSGENRVVLANSSADIFSQKGQISSKVSYLFIKEIYPNIDKVFAIVNETINSVK